MVLNWVRWIIVLLAIALGAAIALSAVPLYAAGLTQPALLAPNPTAAPTADTPPHYTFPVELTTTAGKKGKISYGKYHHDYPAADIFCPIGSRFVAPTAGTVEWISREDTWTAKKNDPATRGGLSIAIIGDDGVRYYGSHLSAVVKDLAVGQRVETGQLLGLTGKSGDARVTDAHLHFGISHPTTADDWATRRGEIAPYPYLKAWQRGEDVTPVLK